MSGLTPTGIHILDADGQVLRNDVQDRTAGRRWARKLSRRLLHVWLVDPEFNPRVTPYACGHQAEELATEGIPELRLSRATESSATDTGAASDAAEAPPTLPDLLRPGLDLVFVGLNPAAYSAQRGHYYSHDNNVFWDMLSASPLVDEKLGPEDDRSLPDRFSIGLTDVVKRVESDSTKVSRQERCAARAEFERRIAKATPRAVCFNSADAFKVWCQRCWVSGGWGRQSVRIAGAEVWVIPSTSPQRRDLHPKIPRVLADLARALGRSATR